MKLNHAQLASLIENLKGAKPIGVLAETDARLLKTGNLFGKVFKTVRAVGFCGADYGSAVRKEQLRQGLDNNFQAESLPWGVWRIPNKLIEHKGELYLRMETTPGQRKRQPAKVLGYRTESGQRVEKEQIKRFFPKETESAKQAEAGLEGKASQIFVRNYKFSSIKKVRINGKTFEITK